jgi:hypothetical protein
MKRNTVYILLGYTVLLLFALLWPLTVLADEPVEPPILEGLFVLPIPKQTCVTMPYPLHAVCTRTKSKGYYWLTCTDKHNKTHRFLIPSEES